MKPAGRLVTTPHPDYLELLMSVSVTRTADGAAALAWDPQVDDPHGHLAAAIDAGHLAAALTALGDGRHGPRTRSVDQARRLARGSGHLARALEDRQAVLVRRLKEAFGQSWSQIAEALLGDATKRSSAQRKYQSATSARNNPEQR